MFESQLSRPPEPKRVRQLGSADSAASSVCFRTSESDVTIKRREIRQWCHGYQKAPLPQFHAFCDTSKRKKVACTSAQSRQCTLNFRICVGETRKNRFVTFGGEPLQDDKSRARVEAISQLEIKAADSRVLGRSRANATALHLVCCNFHRSTLHPNSTVEGCWLRIVKLTHRKRSRDGRTTHTLL